jgi:hypothetical protein
VAHGVGLLDVALDELANRARQAVIAQVFE